MKKISKVMMGLALAPLFFAAAARAEVAIDMGVEGYMPAVSEGETLRSERLEALAEAVERVSGAADRGDAAGAEKLLAGLYSGSAAAGKPAVTAAAPRARRVPPAARAASAAPETKPAFRDAPASPSVSVSTAPAGGSAEKPEEKKDDDKKPPFWQQALAGLIGLGAVAFFMLVLL